jgi:hypothetical protein
MILNIKIDTRSSAFSDTYGYCGTELSRVLAELAGRLNAKTQGEVVNGVHRVLLDHNGVDCGRVWVEGANAPEVRT